MMTENEIQELAARVRQSGSATPLFDAIRGALAIIQPRFDKMYNENMRIGFDLIAARGEKAMLFVEIEELQAENIRLRALLDECRVAINKAISGIGDPDETLPGRIKYALENELK